MIVNGAETKKESGEHIVIFRSICQFVTSFFIFSLKTDAYLLGYHVFIGCPNTANLVCYVRIDDVCCRWGFRLHIHADVGGFPGFLPLCVSVDEETKDMFYRFSISVGGEENGTCFVRDINTGSPLSLSPQNSIFGMTHSTCLYYYYHRERRTTKRQYNTPSCLAPRHVFPFCKTVNGIIPSSYVPFLWSSFVHIIGRTRKRECIASYTSNLIILYY